MVRAVYVLSTVIGRKINWKQIWRHLKQIFKLLEIENPLQHDKFGKFGVRSMRSEESKTLTRLVVRSVGNDLTSSSQCHHNFANTSRSPPPPRCLTNGKTMIVPWNRGKGPLKQKTQFWFNSKCNFHSLHNSFFYITGNKRNVPYYSSTLLRGEQF